MMPPQPSVNCSSSGSVFSVFTILLETTQIYYEHSGVFGDLHMCPKICLHEICASSCQNLKFLILRTSFIDYILDFLTYDMQI